MGKFSMNDLLNSQSKQTQAADNDFDIKKIPIEKIVPSANNKYGIRDIEELAENIETYGLMHNLLVKQPDSDGNYEIISGERRYRACKLVHDRGNEKYATIPCKVEGSEDAAFSELKLIYANAMSRELTDYEKTYQAGRIKELVQELKAKGVKLPGRTREIVAEILKVSPAQMGRMESINERLSPEFTEEFKTGSIGITTAYELSTLPEPAQAEAVKEFKQTGAAAVKDVKKKTAPKDAEPKTTAAPVAQAAQPRTAPKDSASETRIPDRVETIRRLRVIVAEFEAGNDGSNIDIHGTCMDAAFLLDGEA